MEFGERVRKLRQESGISITELASRLGVTKVYVSDVELGRRSPFSLARIKQVSDVLGCDPFELYVLSVRSRGHVTLPMEGVDDRQSRLASVLSYRWNDFSSDELDKLIGAL